MYRVPSVLSVIERNNTDSVLGLSYLKHLFILHPDHIPTGNVIGMQSYFSPDGD